MSAAPATAESAATRSTSSPRPLLGIVPPLVTPFNDRLTLDEQSLAALCDFLIEAGVHALYPCGSTGESVLLTTEERMAVAETVIRAARGRVPVCVHVGAAGTEETVALARHAARTGADAVGAITPYYFAHDAESLRRHYLALAEAVAPLPVYLYNLPSHARNVIAPPLAAELAACAPNVVGIKDSSGSVDALRALCSLGTLDVLSGTDGLNLEALRTGCAGMVSGNANADPEAFVALWRAWQAGDEAEALRAQTRIDHVRRTLFTQAGLANFKAVLVRRGVLRTAAVRAPLAPADGAGWTWPLPSAA